MEHQLDAPIRRLDVLFEHGGVDGLARRDDHAVVDHRGEAAAAGKAGGRTDRLDAFGDEAALDVREPLLGLRRLVEQEGALRGGAAGELDEVQGERSFRWGWGSCRRRRPSQGPNRFGSFDGRTGLFEESRGGRGLKVQSMPDER